MNKVYEASGPRCHNCFNLYSHRRVHAITVIDWTTTGLCNFCMNSYEWEPDTWTFGHFPGQLPRFTAIRVNSDGSIAGGSEAPYPPELRADDPAIARLIREFSTVRAHL